MTTVSDLLETSDKVNVLREIDQAFYESADVLIRLQKEQLFSGERSDGDQIFNVKTGSEYYSPSYARVKGKEEPIDLKRTGNFYDGIKTSEESEGLFITSDDTKTKKLTENYGEEIFGLNETSDKEFIPAAGNRLVRNLEIQLSE